MNGKTVVHGDGFVEHVWEGLGANDTGGKATVFPFSRGLTVAVSGDFSTATVTIQGSNDGDAWFTLHSRRLGSGSNVALGALSEGGIEALLEAPRYIRPVVTDSGTPDLTVIVGGIRA